MSFTLKENKTGTLIIWFWTVVLDQTADRYRVSSHIWPTDLNSTNSLAHTSSLLKIQLCTLLINSYYYLLIMFIVKNFEHLNTILLGEVKMTTTNTHSSVQLPHASHGEYLSKSWAKFGLIQCFERSLSRKSHFSVLG